MNIFFLDPLATIDVWGYLLNPLREDDSASAKQQFNNYVPGGWRKFDGFTLNESDMSLNYPGDPSLKPISYIEFRDETIYLYRHSWVLVMQKSGSWEVARLD